MSDRRAQAAKETLFWIFGYRRCPNCEQFSNAGWFDEQGVWYCEECQVNCILDLFDDGFAVEEEPWLLVRAGRLAARLPLILGYHVGTAALRAAGFGAAAALRGVGSALGVGAGEGVAGAAAGRGRWWPFRGAAAGGAGAVLTAEVFDAPWHVVDGREGEFAIGDPVDVDGGQGVVRARRTAARFTVESTDGTSRK